MNIDIITQYILAIVPAFTAVVGMITTLGVAISKIKKANKETSTQVEELSKNDRALKKQLVETQKENAELKKNFNKVLAKMDHLYFVEKDYVKEIKED